MTVWCFLLEVKCIVTLMLVSFLFGQLYDYIIPLPSLSSIVSLSMTLHPH